METNANPATDVQITVQPDGSSEKHFNDGTKEVTDTEGNVTTTKANGEWKTVCKNGEVHIPLAKCGKKAVIIPGVGKHSREALRIAGTNNDLFLPALMSLLVEIDGKGITVEQLEAIPLKDYNAIQTAFSEVNF